MTNESTDTVSRLLEGWRTLALWQKEGHPGHRKWNQTVDGLNALAEVAVADTANVHKIEAIARRDPDPFVRLLARQVIKPDVPHPDADADLKRWMNNPLINVGELNLRAELGLAVVPLPEEGQHAPENVSERRTWLLGEPLEGLPRWPRRSDNVPLAHLLQVELNEHPLLTKRHAGLPEAGVLQFFHDLEAIGDDLEELRQGAWLVHYCPNPGVNLLARPNDIGEDAFRPGWPADTEVTWTFPNPLDLDLSDDEFDRVELANRRVIETLVSPQRLEGEQLPVDAVPMMFGHGTQARNVAIERLGDVIPLRSDDDSYVLLADIPGVGPFDGWIGDMGHIEFWIRATDLKTRTFNQAWALTSH